MTWTALKLPLGIAGLMVATVPLWPPSGGPSSIEDRTCDPAALAVSASLDTRALRSTGRATLALAIHGTEAPVKVRLINRSPGVVSFAAGSTLLVETSGGRDNRASHPLYALRAGQFEIGYELPENACRL